MTMPMDDTPLPSFAGNLRSWSDTPPYGAQQPRRRDTHRAMMLSEELSTRRFIDLEAPLAATASAIAERLSVRQRDILDLIAQGRSNKEIARVLSIAPETVKTHVKHIFIKLNVAKRAQAVSRAHNLGLAGTL